MSSVFDRILTSVPNNATAAAVTSQSGDHYDPEISFGDLLHWKAPPHLKPLPKSETFTDLTGRKFGDFTVIGFLGKLNPKKKSLWLVRCSCGDYEARHANAIHAAPVYACCFVCSHWRKAKLRYETEGPRPIGDFIR